MALKCDKLTLITFDTAETVSINGRTIEIVPAIDWLCQCYEEREIPEKVLLSDPGTPSPKFLERTALVAL